MRNPDEEVMIATDAVGGEVFFVVLRLGSELERL